MRYLFLTILFSSNFLFTQETVRVNTGLSSISYSGKHFLHSWNSENTNISGIIEVDDKKISNLGVVAKVIGFRSGNSNLDSNSYRVLEAFKFPNIIFKSSNIEYENEQLLIKGILNFHGVEKEISTNFIQTEEINRIILTGSFTISLDEFNIDRPSLLLRKIDDEIEIKVKLVYR
jgi:polyisoprenoid-binding protein YceI